MRYLLSLATLFSLDRATGYAIGARGFSAISGSVTVLFIARYFSLELQGFYYTFGSVLTFQTFLELGFGTLIQQFASHEWAHLSLGENGEIVGDDRARRRLGSLARFSFRWYAIAGFIAVIGLSLGGVAYFSTFAPESDSMSVNWFWPWLAVCLLTGATMLLTPVLSILEGCNQVTRVYGVQLAQGVAGRAVTWFTMFWGGGLWAIAGGRIAGLLLTGTFLLRRYDRFFGALLRSTGPEPVSESVPEFDTSSDQIRWKEEIWPLQWKFALTWIGGYLLFALFTPIVFAFQSAEAAGQMGMTLALVNVLTSVSYALLSTKIPQLAQHAARREFTDLDQLFRRVATSSMLAAGIGALSIWLILYTLSRSEATLATRFLPPLEAGALLAAAFILQLRYALGAYLRAHKEEPYLHLSVIEGLAATIGLFILGRFFGTLGMTLGFLAIVTVSIIPAIVIFQRKRLAWRQDKQVLL